MFQIKQVGFLFIFILLFTFPKSVFPQKTLIYSDIEKDYKTGTELFAKEKFGAAQKHFEKITSIVPRPSLPVPQDEILTNAQFYIALCALELFHSDAEFLLKQFIDEHPESAKLKYAMFQMGTLQYRQKSYKAAVNWFEKVEISDLNNTELAEYYFKLGYSYFMLSNQYLTLTPQNKSTESTIANPQTLLDKASKNFYQIRDVNTQYTAPAVYYYSHIAYLKNNYETALQGFLKLSNDKNFGSVVPYYIAQ